MLLSGFTYTPVISPVELMPFGLVCSAPGTSIWTTDCDMVGLAPSINMAAAITILTLFRIAPSRCQVVTDSIHLSRSALFVQKTARSDVRRALAASPEALAWSEQCRSLYSDFGLDYAQYAMGSLADRCFAGGVYGYLNETPMAWGRDGHLYWGINGLHPNRTDRDVSILVARSDNYGDTWSSTLIADGRQATVDPAFISRPVTGLAVDSRSGPEDIVYTDKVSGIHANFLKSTVPGEGFEAVNGAPVAFESAEDAGAKFSGTPIAGRRIVAREQGREDRGLESRRQVRLDASGDRGRV